MSARVVNQLPIESFRTYHVSLPIEPPITSGRHFIDQIDHVLIEIHAGGLIGHGYTFGFSTDQVRAVRWLVRDLAGSVVGRDAGAVKDVWDSLWERINFIGQAGASVMALAAVDTAMWDLLGQASGMPLYRLLGGEGGRVPLYAAGGWLSLPVEGLVEEAQSFVADGYRAYKLRVGQADWRRDVERVAAVRDAIGPDVGLMVDVNQAWSVDQAIGFGKAIAPYGLGWIEEPVAADDFDGAARVAAALDVPVAAGETVFTSAGFERIIDARAADILQPDLMRCGGPTEFLRVLTLAERARLPVVSHLFAEISAHLLCTTRRRLLAEHLPSWSSHLFSVGPVVEHGEIVLNDRPGLGVEFSSDTISRYAIDTEIQ